MRAIEGGHAEPLTSRRPGLPPEIVSVVERAMSLDPRRRFGSAVEMADALEPPRELEAAAPVPINAAHDAETVPIDRGSRDGATQTLHLPSAPEVEQRPRTTPVRSHVMAIAVGAGLAAILVVGIFASQRGPSHPATSVPSTTAPAPKATPTSTKLPAPLNDAIRRLEQTVAP
jgi:serine/threonine-protein kinase